MRRVRKYLRLARVGGRTLARLAYRVATAKRRVLPNLYVLGPPRSGTSSLDHYVRQHPSYVAPYMKELGYAPAQQNRPHGEFNESFYRHIHPRLRTPVVRAVQGLYYRGGEAGYRKLFPLASTMAQTKRQTGCAITADHTVLGLYSSATTDGFPYSIACGDTRFVAILRNPIDFLFSFYNTEINRHFREINRDVSFDHFVHNPEDLYADARGMEATRANLERWRPLFERRPYFNPAEFSIATALVSYIVFIKEWSSKLPADRFLVLDFSDLRDKTQETMDRVFDFLGMSQFQITDTKARNVGKYQGRTVPPEAAAYIEEVCRPYNHELYEFLGRDLGWS